MTDLSVFSTWFKTRRSAPDSNCVEAAFADDDSGRVAVRNSKDRDGATVIFTGSEWATFVAGVKDGEFDRS
ncbi:DUF397 domain-containing protein [Actinoplanes sp. NPDC026619]|uniref:DUF397 domain-containing protein n=1 Tax=Actinoplanes sp. NPDC026619 TaxID=3155798 RepID=UPI003406D847